MKEDAELKQFRDLLPPPDHFDDGFGLKAMIGGLFVGLIMTPASMYMQLVVGQNIGQAAQWVTVILFLEVARRSFTVLTKPEIYVLYYMAGAVLVSTAPGQGLLWNQFIVQSESMQQFGIADKIPSWVSPKDPDILGSRSFFNSAWLAPIGLFALAQVLQRFDNFGLAYIMYRLTSDVEKLPFPLAPVGAAGITALADAQGGGENSWRWRVFSFGGVLGMGFAVVYVALPSITGAFLGSALSIFPLPFYDLTKSTEGFLPAVPMIISFDLGLLIVGMVLPFWAMVGSFIGLLFTITLNPILVKTGVLNEWQPGIDAIPTIQANTLDFYFSFGLGLVFAIAVIGFWHVFRTLRDRSDGQERVDWGRLFNPPAGRGDFSLWIAAGVYVATTGATILIAYLLLNHAYNQGEGSAMTPLLIGVFLFYGFIYTPIISYVAARMEGIVGMTVSLPFVREATFILTGYQGAAVWFAPFPIHNYGAQTLYFRTTELTGTKITSMVKAEIFIVPIFILSTVLFSHFIWQIAPVPSSAFPYADKFWELIAFQQGITFSSTLPGGENGPFAEAFKPMYLGLGFTLAVGAYALLTFLSLPVLLVYGVIRGLDQSTPDVILPQFLGALMGRYYFSRKFGDMWPQYRVVFFAGYSAGFGLIMMFSLGLVFMSKSVFQSVY